MARIRTIKPEFFKHEALYDAERLSGLPLRVAFAGLWTQCDREGRFPWRPRQLKTDILPYDDIDFSRVLHALATRGFVVRYASQEGDFGYIPSWRKHQVPNNREKASEYPAPTPEAIEKAKELDACPTRDERVPDATLQLPSGKGRGKEGEGELDTSAPQGAAEGVARVVPMKSPEARVYDRGREILGPSAGGLVTKLLRRHGGNPALAMASLEVASTKSDPREYIGAIIANHGDDKPDPRGEYGRDWG